MKKALLLGALAFFAINIATVQNVNAQNKETKQNADITKIEKEKAAAQAATLKNEGTNVSKKATGTAETTTKVKKNEKSTTKVNKAAAKAAKADSKKEAKLSSSTSSAKGAPASMKPKNPSQPQKATAGKKTTTK